MKFAIKIAGSAATLAAVPGDFHGEALGLTDQAGNTIYALPISLAAAFDDGPVTFANGKLRAAKVQVEPCELRAVGSGAGLWAGLINSGQSPSLPDMPEPWAQAIAEAAK